MTRRPAVPKIRLEEGKIYRDGRGWKIGPIFPIPVERYGQRMVWGAHNTEPYPNKWTKTGHVSMNAKAPKVAFDLYQEWSDDDGPEGTPPRSSPL